jgi:hypothetical protein
MARYLDLEIKIHKRDAEFRVRGHDYSGRHGLDAKTLADLSELRAKGRPAEYGRRLFDAVFGKGQLRDGIRAARNEVEHGVSWRVRLNVDKPLNELWWECLNDASPPPQVLGRSRETPLSRYLVGGATKGVSAEKLKVLVVIANPADLGSPKWRNFKRLSDQQERATIVRAFRGLKDRIDYEILKGPATTTAIRDRLISSHGDHILHIVAHGTRDKAGTTALLLETPARKAQLVRQETLAELVKVPKSVRLVVLAACRGAWQSGESGFAGLGPLLVHHGVPAVVAMQDPIDETSAMFFTQKFYEAIARRSDETGGMVDVAMNEARDAIFFESVHDETWNWAIPVLFLRGTGRLFKIETQGGQRQRDRSSRGAVDEPSALASQAPGPLANDGEARKARERSNLWDLLTLEARLDAGELDVICNLFWNLKFDDLPGDNEGQKKLYLIRRAQAEKLDLASRIRAATKLRDLNKVPAARGRGSPKPAAASGSWSDLSGSTP